MKSLGSLRLQQYDENEINKCTNVEHRFVCFICIEICFSIEKLKLHYVNVHGYKSPVEEPGFGEVGKITKEEVQPPSESKSYYSSKICSVCSSRFKNSKTLSKHVKTVHNKLKSFICSVCSKQFSRKATLDVSFEALRRRRKSQIFLRFQIHLRQHLSSDENSKTFSCPQADCSFRAADPSVMSKHKKLHQKTNEGKYKCPDEHCQYYAIQATGLKNHVISKHPALFKATMKCSHSNCEFVSVNPERLRRHLSDHEKGLLDKKEEARKVEEVPKANLNSSMEVPRKSRFPGHFNSFFIVFLQISSDSFLPIESTDSIVNHSLDTGGVTIIHIHNTSSSTNVHSEDTVF